MERGIKMDKELEFDVDEFVDDFIEEQEEQQELEFKEAIDKLDEDDDGQQDLTLNLSCLGTAGTCFQQVAPLNNHGGYTYRIKCE